MSFGRNPWQFPSGSLQWFQQFFLKEICYDFNCFSSGKFTCRKLPRICLKWHLREFPSEKTVEKGNLPCKFPWGKPLKSSQISFRKNRWNQCKFPLGKNDFLEWFQEFFLKEICDDFKGLSEGLWQTSFQKLRILGKKKDLRISFRKKQLKFRNRTFTRFKDPTPQGGMK